MDQELTTGTFRVEIFNRTGRTAVLALLPGAGPSVQPRSGCARAAQSPQAPRRQRRPPPASSWASAVKRGGRPRRRSLARLRPTSDTRSDATRRAIWCQRPSAAPPARKPLGRPIDCYPPRNTKENGRSAPGDFFCPIWWQFKSPHLRIYNDSFSLYPARAPVNWIVDENPGAIWARLPSLLTTLSVMY